MTNATSPASEIVPPVYAGDKMLIRHAGPFFVWVTVTGVSFLQPDERGKGRGNAEFMWGVTYLILLADEQGEMYRRVEVTRMSQDGRDELDRVVRIKAAELVHDIDPPSLPM